MGCILIYVVSASYHEKQPAICCSDIARNSEKLCFLAWIIQTYSTIELGRTHKTHQSFSASKTLFHSSFSVMKTAWTLVYLNAERFRQHPVSTGALNKQRYRLYCNSLLPKSSCPIFTSPYFLYLPDVCIQLPQLNVTISCSVDM